jgi:hypothetical protein
MFCGKKIGGVGDPSLSLICLQIKEIPPALP